MYNNAYIILEVILMKCKKISFLLMTMSIIVMMAGCGVNASSQSSTLDRVKASGKLVLGTSADYPPFEFHMEENGQDKIVGMDISLGEEIAKDLGVKLEVKDMDFDGLLAALTTDNVDVVIASMNATEERKKSVDFSNVYYMAQQKTIIREEDYDKYKTIDSLKNAKIGTQKGSIQEGIAQDQLPDAGLRSLAKITDLVLDLKAKNVDAIIVENTVAEAYVKNTGGIKVGEVVFETPDNTGSSIAIKKGNEGLVEKINATIDRLKKDGSLDKFLLDNINLGE